MMVVPSPRSSSQEMFDEQRLGSVNQPLKQRPMNTPRSHADWFTRITGFSERSYQDTQALLRVEDEQLISLDS